jgi:hypothetical protein
MKVWAKVLGMVIASVLLLPGWTDAASGPSHTPQARQQQAPALSVQSQKPGGPVSREAYYGVQFINNGPTEITIDRTADGCMYDAGPGSIYVPSYGSASINLADDNHFRFKHNCSDQPKWVQWTVHPVTEKGNTTPYEMKFRHVYFQPGDLQCIVSAFWCTTIEGPHGQSSGNGLVTSADCGDNGCLNEWVPDPGDINNNIKIYFDGSYQGTKQPAVITWPGPHSAIHGDDPPYVAIKGTATPDTQVSVTAKGQTENPWADDNGNWTTNPVYHFDTGQVFSATVTSTVEGTDTSTFISVTPVVITGPPSPVNWVNSITVTGTAFPSAIVVVRSDPQNPDAPSCSGVADNTGNWSCGLSGMTAGADYNITAWQQGIAGGVMDGWSWLDPVQAQWPLQVNAIPLAITSPTDGGHIDGDSPPVWAISGTGTPGGQVIIDTPYSTTRPVSVSIDQNGNWKTGLVFQFPPTQSYTVPASQTINGQPGPGASVTFASWPSLKFNNPAYGATLPSNQTTLAMSGTGVPGGMATPGPLSPNNGAVACSVAPIDQNGSWSCPIANLTPGFYGASMQQALSGQYDPSVPILFAVAQPVIIDQPIAGQAYPPQTTQVTFSGQGQPGATLKVAVPGANPCGNQVIPSPGQGNAGQWSCLVAGLQPGKSYTATVTQGSSDQVVDALRWTDPGVTRQFSIDGFDPLTIQAPTENQVFSSPTTSITASGQAQPGAQLRIDVPGAQPCSQQTVGPAPGNWQCPVSGLQSGKKYLLTATQSLGGVSDVPRHVDFAVATPVTVLLPKENQVLAAGTTQIDISGTGQPAANIAVTAAPAQPCNTTADDQGRWQCAVTGLTSGTSYTANVVQSGSGWQDPVAMRHFSVAAAVGISIGAPRNNAVVSSNNPIDGIPVSGTGQSGAVASVVVGTDPPRLADIVNGAWATDPVPLSRFGVTGATLSIVATEYVDNNPVGSNSVNITVAKVATVTSPQDQEMIQDIGKVTVLGQGQEGANITVQLMDGGSPKKGCDATVSGGAWSCALSGIMPSSSYTLNVLQSGQAGEWTDQPVGRVFRTRTPRPVTYSSPAPGQGMPVDTPYDVGGTGEPNARVSLKLMGVFDLGFADVQGDGTWVFPKLLSSKPGCYSLTALQTLDGYPLDQGAELYPVGNATCPGGSPFYIALPMPDQVLTGSSYTVQGYGVPGYTVTIANPPGGSPCQTQVQPDGTWSCGPYAISATGGYSVAAQQTETPNGGPGPSVSRSFTLLNPVAIAYPANNAVIYWPRMDYSTPFSVSGTATPGNWVQVSQSSDQDPQYGTAQPQLAQADPSGRWTTPAVFQTPPPSLNAPGARCDINGCVSAWGTLHARQIYKGENRDENTVMIRGQWFVRQGAEGSSAPSGPAQSAH